MNFLNYTYFKICLILEIFIIIGVESFTPVGRVAHTSALVGTKLYFFGGTTAADIYSNEVFYLDASQTFNTKSPPFVDLTESAKMPFKSSWAGMSLIDNNNDSTAYLFGGVMRDLVTNKDTFNSIVYSFNIKESKWEIPNINGQAPERRRDVKPVKDDTGKIYIFGGASDSTTGSAKAKYLNDMIIFDGLTWKYGVKAPIENGAYSAYTATMLNNGVIAYIGGKQQVDKLVDINKISLYNTKLDTWSTMTAKSSNVIGSRCSHSAVLAPNGNIIIFGGGTFNEGHLDKVNPDIAVLNTEKTPYEWTYPTMPSSNNQPPSIFGHTANLIGNYMVIAFGNINPSNNVNLNTKVYVMDIRNYMWVDTLEVEATSTDSNNNNVTKIVIGVLSGVIGILLIGIIGFFGIRWHKKKKRNIRDRNGILSISGSNEINEIR